MAEYRAPVRDIQFALYDVLDAEQHYARIDAGEASRDLVDAIISEGGKFAQEVLSPLNQSATRSAVNSTRVWSQPRRVSRKPISNTWKAAGPRWRAIRHTEARACPSRFRSHSMKW